MSKGWTAALIALLLVMAGFKFARQDFVYLSGPDVMDFIYVYLPGHAWMEGKQPYTSASVREVAAGIYGPVGAKTYKGIDSYYPPTAFVASLPLLILPHQVVAFAMFTVSLGAYLWLAWILAWRLAAMERALFLAFALNYAPLHSGLRPGNITVLVAVMLLIPLLAMARNRGLSAWWFIFVGLGIAIKPELGGPFLLLLLAMRECKRLAVAAGTVAACGALAVGWMAINGVHWLPPFLEGLRQGPADLEHVEETTASFVFNGAANFRRIDLSPVVYLFSGNARMSIVVPLALAGILLLILMVVLWRRAGRESVTENEWVVVICAFGAIAMLPVYTRYYSALLLLPVFVWMWNRVRRGLLKAFLIAGAAIFSLPTPQFPVIWEAAMLFLKDPLSNLSQASGLLTYRGSWELRPAYWQEVICALPNLFVLAVGFLLTAMIVRRTYGEELGFDRVGN
ncbi:MAG: glycosyltransferase family 87 protein [Terracidiphilus sp.]